MLLTGYIGALDLFKNVWIW